MSRLTLLNSPLLLGFEQFERTLDRIAKSSSDGYPPYNIERVGDDGLRITLAVAGFAEDDLTIEIQERQLVVRGKQEDDPDRVYLHRGIAARQFQRAFVLADGIDVTGAALDNGLLSIDMHRPVPEQHVRTIAISRGAAPRAGRSKSIDVTPERSEP
ncbi:MAG: Hsp20 family protein [Inquilinaceae bacterium]